MITIRLKMLNFLDFLIQNGKEINVAIRQICSNF